MGDEFAELASGHVTGDQHNAAVALEGRGNDGTVLVEREVAGVNATGGRGVDVGKLAIPLVDLETVQRVRGQLGAVGSIKVVDQDVLLVARRHYHELVVGRDLDLGSRSALRGGLGTLTTREALVDLLELELASLARGDLETVEGVGQFADDVEEGLAVDLGKSTVPGTGSRRQLDRLLLGVLESLRIDGQDTDSIGTQVRDDKELALRVEDGLMRERLALAVRHRTRLVKRPDLLLYRYNF